MARDRIAYCTRLWQRTQRTRRMVKQFAFVEDGVFEMASGIKSAISGDMLASVLKDKTVVTLPVELTQARPRLGVAVCELTRLVP
jgi:hypothetical protein